MAHGRKQVIVKSAGVKLVASPDLGDLHRMIIRPQTLIGGVVNLFVPIVIGSPENTHRAKNILRILVREVHKRIRPMNLEGRPYHSVEAVPNEPHVIGEIDQDVPWNKRKFPVNGVDLPGGPAKIPDDFTRPVLAYQMRPVQKGIVYRLIVFVQYAVDAKIILILLPGKNILQPVKEPVGSGAGGVLVKNQHLYNMGSSVICKRSPQGYAPLPKKKIRSPGFTSNTVSWLTAITSPSQIGLLS